MRAKTCCFTGHRSINTADYDNIKQRLHHIIEKLIADGVIYYGCGGALGFDTMAAETILELREVYTSIKLIMVCPCLEQDKFWSARNKEKYREILQRADKVVYVSKEYTEDCMLKRNRHLVDNSKYCICYLKKPTGGTAYTVTYAKENGLTIIPV